MEAKIKDLIKSGIVWISNSEVRKFVSRVSGLGHRVKVVQNFNGGVIVALV